MIPRASLCVSVRGHLWRICAAVLLAIALLPASPVLAQDGDARPVTPAALAQQLAHGPRLRTAAVPDDLRLPPGVTRDQVAQMPDRTQYAVIDYKVEGDSVHATVQLRATQDVFISSAQPDRNFAGDAVMNLGWDPGQYNAMRALLQFDLSPLPANAQINSATFYAYQTYINPTYDTSPMAFRAQFMQQPWSEGSVTWNNANYLGGTALPLGDLPPAIGWITGGATDAVKAWDRGQPNYGLIITGDETPSNGRWRQLYTRTIPQFAPYILVNYTVNCDTQPPIASLDTLPKYVPSEFKVTWSAYDPDQPGCKASGVANYDVQYRINGGNWTGWKNQSSATSNHFKGWAPNAAYVELQARATDKAGNVGAWSPPVATTVDSESPVATIDPLPQFTPYSTFTVSWSGTDNLSGIAYYNVQFRKNDGVWTNLIVETTEKSFQITGGQQGDIYRFRAQAADNAGNVQAWPTDAQAVTTIFDHPVGYPLPFNPYIIKPTAAVTNTIPVKWSGFTPPNTTIVEYKVYYRYEPFGGTLGNWTLWNTYPGSQETDNFDYKSAGTGNGLYEFYVTAKNNLDEEQPFDPQHELTEPVVLDLNDQLEIWAYLPIMSEYNENQ